MKDNDDIPATDTTEIKQLINRVKQGELDRKIAAFDLKNYTLISWSS
jgi:hypothetical protein